MKIFFPGTGSKKHVLRYEAESALKRDAMARNQPEKCCVAGRYPRLQAEAYHSSQDAAAPNEPKCSGGGQDQVHRYLVEVRPWTLPDRGGEGQRVRHCQEGRGRRLNRLVCCICGGFRCRWPGTRAVGAAVDCGRDGTVIACARFFVLFRPISEGSAVCSLGPAACMCKSGQGAGRPQTALRISRCQSGAWADPVLTTADCV